VDQLSLASARQIQITYEHVAGIETCPHVVTFARVTVTFLAPVLVPIAGVVLHMIAPKRRRTRTASQYEPLLLAIANTVVSVA
jgi:hypothetical protein